jgi:hypothetical protein
VAALAVAGVAATVAAFVHTGGGRPNQIAPFPVVPTWVIRQPADLVGSWVLTDLQGFDGVPHTAPNAALTFRFYPDGTMSQGCGTARVTVGVGTIVFDEDWVTTVPTGCPHLGVRQTRFLFGQVLTDAARWEIHSGQLRVDQDKVAAAFQRIAGGLTAAQEALAVRLAKQEARTSSASGSSASNVAGPGQSDWPANVERVSALVTSGADGMRYVDAKGSDKRFVLVIRLVGEFSWVTTAPAGHGPATGNVITIVADARTGKILATRLVRQRAPQAVPDATMLYTQ